MVFMDYQALYDEWLTSPCFDEATKAELRGISEEEKKDRFYTELEFGTAGLRGVIGAGLNRMNIYTVRKATQGLANYIIKAGEQKKGVAIAYDSRRMSPEFAKEAALCLAANGIKAYLFESLRPTPELSFAVRKLGCIAGINITASHNPPEYNGYKVYWEDGAQITPPHDKGIMAEVKAITDFSTLKTMQEDNARVANLFEIIGGAIDDAYIAELKKQVKNQDAIDEMQDQLTIVYTPLHGTGNVPARRVLKELGFTHVYVVPEQELPDGEFPTVSYPNPEAAEAFELALALAKEKNAFATTRVFDYIGGMPGDKEIILMNSCQGDMKHWSENTCWIFDADFEYLCNDSVVQLVCTGARCRDYKLRLLMAGVPEERIVCEPDEFRAAELLRYTPGDDVYILYGTDSLALSYKVYDHMKEEAARHAQDGAEKEAQA